MGIDQQNKQECDIYTVRPAISSYKHFGTTKIYKKVHQNVVYTQSPAF